MGQGYCENLVWADRSAQFAIGKGISQTPFLLHPEELGKGLPDPGFQIGREEGTLSELVRQLRTETDGVVPKRVEVDGEAVSRGDGFTP